MKGSTNRLFTNYSDGLRAMLFGPALRSESKETGGDSYYYPMRGLKIDVRTFGLEEKDAALRGDTILIVDLVPPQK